MRYSYSKDSDQHKIQSDCGCVDMRLYTFLSNFKLTHYDALLCDPTEKKSIRNHRYPDVDFY